MTKPYYTVYESRYSAVYAAGVSCWGHSPSDEALRVALTKWVDENQLSGKRIIEFACGEGASGVILAELGCSYRGMDIAPSAVEKANEALKDFPDAEAVLSDMVCQTESDRYDAALDVMGFHMLVTDPDRKSYLKNAFACLKPGAPMLFFREFYSAGAFEGKVASFADWKEITHDDYETPQKRTVGQHDAGIEVYIPFVPARERTREGYHREMTEAGFVVDSITEMEASCQIQSSVTIFVHKPTEL